MTAEELRIGNYIRATLAVLDDLTEQPGFIDRPIKDGKDIDRANWFSPIPLSPEWLQRAGFEDESTVNIWMDKIVHPNFPFVLVQSIYKTFRLSPDNFKAPPLTLAWTITNELKFVHQLQNLYYALTGTELTFNQP